MDNYKNKNKNKFEKFSQRKEIDINYKLTIEENFHIAYKN